jgi:CDP-diacylglycerol--glycerol-3-phosphate 3-phosphatidyltransferase
MANLLTLLRFLLLFVLVALAYEAPPVLQQADALLLIFIIALDGLDGYVARRRGETSTFGSVFDIAVDRVVENVLWIVLADLDLVPIWVAIVFITRSLLVDTIRGHAATQGKTPFGMMRSKWGRFIVASRFMRGFYGVVKAATFGWVFFIQPWPSLYPAFWTEWSETLSYITHTLVYMSVTICILRAVPVIVEFATSEDVIRKSKSLQGIR